MFNLFCYFKKFMWSKCSYFSIIAKKTIFPENLAIAFFRTTANELLNSGHFFTKISLNALRRVSSTGRRAHCNTAQSSTPCCRAIRKCKKVVKPRLDYYWLKTIALLQSFRRLRKMSIVNWFA